MLWYKKYFLGDTFAHCSLCGSDFSITHGGKNDVTTHVKGKKHKQAAGAASSSQSVTSFFRPQLRQNVIEAEARWSLFTAKHNLSFLSGDHATKLFKTMFPDSEIAKSFGCGHTKTAAIIKEALSPYFQEKTTQTLSNPFSIMLDESNDKIDKSCIILVRLLDPERGNVSTRFLDMPIVNIGTAQNIYLALKESLRKFGLDFSKAVSFMSDTASVMKGCRSGVQKLIKDEMPYLYDAGCICHIADLSIKAGIGTLPVDIDQLFIDIFIIFIIQARETKSLLIFGAPYLLRSPKQF